MKFNQIILLFTLLTSFTACTESIQGSGDVITETRTATDFDEVEVGEALKVEITQGDFAVEVRADDNIISKIRTNISGDKLEIGYTDNVNFRGNITAEVYVTMPTITHLKLEDAVDGKLINFTGLSELEIDVNDASNLSLSGDVDVLDIMVADASNVRAFDFVTNTCNVDVKGASELDVFCTEVINGTVRDASILRYKGEAEMKATASDASDIKNEN